MIISPLTASTCVSVASQILTYHCLGYESLNKMLLMVPSLYKLPSFECLLCQLRKQTPNVSHNYALIMLLKTCFPSSNPL